MIDAIDPDGFLIDVPTKPPANPREAYNGSIWSYEYQDAEGKFAFAIDRYNQGGKKKFVAWHRNEDGKRVYGMPEQSFLYRLPEVIKAETVLITEGEKCCGAVRNLVNVVEDGRIAATTNPFGASHWKPEYSEYVRGKKVVIFPDNDDAGQKHAQEVAQSCWGIADRIFIANVPLDEPKSDIWDYLGKCENKQEAQRSLLGLIKKAPEWHPQAISVQQAQTPVQPIPAVLAIPEDAMYGYLGEKARTLGTPLSYSYLAVLTVGAAKTTLSYQGTVRPTLYTALMGPVGCGKSESIKRALQCIGLSEDVVKWIVPGSDRGLLNIFGGEKQAGGTFLLAQDELRTTMSKIGIQGSSLASVLCTLWSQDQAGTADKQGEHSISVRLNILGALKCADAMEFAGVFGSETNSGLSDRFVFGVTDGHWKYTVPQFQADNLYGSQCKVPALCYDMLQEWRNKKDGRSRLGEIALRVALISSSLNQDSEITEPAMTAALRFAEWQEHIRAVYKAGVSQSLEARCTEAILTALQPLQQGCKWSELAKAKHFYRTYGVNLCQRVRDGLAKNEAIDYDKKTGVVRLIE